MKAARILIFLALCTMSTQANAFCGGGGGYNSCYGCGGPGYDALTSDCGFASTLWEGFCNKPAYGGGGCGGGCDTGCAPAAGCGGGGCALLSRLRGHLHSLGSGCGSSCGSCCSPGGSWCNSGSGFGGWGGGGCGGGLFSGLHSLGGGCGSSCGSCCSPGGSWCNSRGGFGGGFAGIMSGGGGCGGGCGYQAPAPPACGTQGYGYQGHCGGLRRHARNLHCRLMGGDCGRCNRRYGSLCGFESMCDHVRNFGSYRSWIGGGPLDSCGLVSYDSYPAGGIDYGYLNYVTQSAPVAQQVVHTQPTYAQPVETPTYASPTYAEPAAPASDCGCEGAPVAAPLSSSEGTTIMQDDVSQSLYDGTQSLESNRDSELIPKGKETDN